MAGRKTITVSVTPEQHVLPGDRVNFSRDRSVGEVAGAAPRLIEQTEPEFPARQQAWIGTAAREGR